MEMSLEQNVIYLVKTVDSLSVDIKTIKRGLYGDPDNKVVGLIARQANDELRLDALEAVDKKELFKKKWFTGLLLAATGVVEWILHTWNEISGK